MSRNACNGKNGETREKSAAFGDLNWMPKVAPWRLAILAKIARGLVIMILKVPDLWETGDFGENGETGEKSPASGDLNSDAKRGPLKAGDFGENRQGAGQSISHLKG